MAAIAGETHGSVGPLGSILEFNIIVMPKNDILQYIIGKSYQLFKLTQLLPVHNMKEL